MPSCYEYTKKLSEDERLSLRGGAFSPKQSPRRGGETASQKALALTPPDTFWVYFPASDRSEIGEDSVKPK
jgi:hypothetical protein